MPLALVRDKGIRRLYLYLPRLYLPQWADDDRMWTDLATVHLDLTRLATVHLDQPRLEAVWLFGCQSTLPSR
jgi:hypothetical protein